ncbi:GLUG motif-containing protein, partial [Enterobacter hormaechei]
GLNVGGLVGYNMFGHVSDSSASGQVEAGGAGNTGGLVGLSSGGEIFRSQASGSVYSKGGLATGGLIGKAEGNGMLGNLKASGSVTDQGGADLG